MDRPSVVQSAYTALPGQRLVELFQRFGESTLGFSTILVMLCGVLPKVAYVNEHNELGSAVRKPILSTLPAVLCCDCAYEQRVIEAASKPFYALSRLSEIASQIRQQQAFRTSPTKVLYAEYNSQLYVWTWGASDDKPTPQKAVS